jgi:peptidyl-prolyl cis-trans isomerase A (cyclophilin A)/peptidyl-prolyl cis-trans isomerase B (cyclophilin B)
MMNRSSKHYWTLPLAAFLAVACAEKAKKDEAPAQSPKEPAAAATKPAEAPAEKAPDAAMPKSVVITTSMGDITVELYGDKAPATVKNFVEYVNSKHYEGTIFHRVIDGFMIQGGGFDESLTQKPTRSPVRNEADNGLKNEIYTLAMARTSDPHSASAQFFINVKNNEFLNHSSKTPQGWGYTVFGKVTAGQDVVDQIAKVPTGGKGQFPTDVPKTTVSIKSMRTE